MGPSLARPGLPNPASRYHDRVSSRPASPRLPRIVLIVVLSLVAALVVVAAAVVVPILTHRSAGGSGQELGGGFAPETSATGADGRTRTLAAETLDGDPADLSAMVPGSDIIVRGSGFDSGIGIYVSVCAVGELGDRPGPCLGGIPETGDGAPTAASSAWVTDDWAWRAFATHRYSDAAAGAFEVRLIVPDATFEGLDCTAEACAITTRADHTASADRVQDLRLPVAFAPAGSSSG